MYRTHGMCTPELRQGNSSPQGGLMRKKDLGDGSVASCWLRCSAWRWREREQAVARTRRLAQGSSVAEAVSRWRVFGAACCWASAARLSGAAASKRSLQCLRRRIRLTSCEGIGCIADLKRLVGQKNRRSRFYRQAFQQVGEERRQSGAPGGTASTGSCIR